MLWPSIAHEDLPRRVLQAMCGILCAHIGSEFAFGSTLKAVTATWRGHSHHNDPTLWQDFIQRAAVPLRRLLEFNAHLAIEDDLLIDVAYLLRQEVNVRLGTMELDDEEG